MPALIDYCGEDDGLFGVISCLDMFEAMYCSPTKRMRVDLSPPRKEDNYEGNKEVPSSTEALPEECLLEIFRHMSGARERSISACVSKRWLTLLSSIRHSDMASLDENLEELNQGFLDRSLEGNKATDVRLAAIAVGTPSRGGVGKLSIRNSIPNRGVTDAGLSAIGHGCPSLRTLCLSSVPTIGDDGLLEIARGCPSLEKLDLCQCAGLTDKGLVAIAEKCSNLTSLTIESCPNVGNIGLQAIGRHCPKLQSVSIKNCPLIGDEGIAGLVSSASTTLKSLKLQQLDITDRCLAVVGRYGLVMTDLVLCWLQNVSQEGFLSMSRAEGLKLLASLTLISCKGVTDLSLESMAKGCPKLIKTRVLKCCFISDSGLVAFAKASKSLESLQLEECHRITQTGLLTALLHCVSKLKSLSIVKCLGIKDVPSGFQTSLRCRSLQSLSIYGCPGFTNRSLALVGKLCPKLRRLNLIGLEQITDEALMPLLETFKEGLVKVDLTKCVNVTDRSIAALSRLHGSTLEMLNLRGCKKITDVSMLAIACYCFVMNELDVSYCSITDAGVAALGLEGIPNFQVLSLYNCSMITDESVPFLKMMAETLIALNIKRCNSLSSSAVNQLVDDMPSCDVFY